MSLQRAKSNCKRCYELAKRTKLEFDASKHQRLEDKSPNYYFNDQLYRVKNDAMIALESVINSIDLRYKISKESIPDAIMIMRRLTSETLDICASCDFDEPNIIKYLKEKRN